MKSLIESKEDYKKILDETISETIRYISEEPTNYLYNTIYEELNEIKDVLYVQKRKPDFDEYELTSLGAIAVKNFEDENPEYAMKLSELDYFYEKYDSLK